MWFPDRSAGPEHGLRDADDIAVIVREALASGEDPGAPQMLSRYGSARRGDITSRTLAIDWANRSLLNDFLPLQSLRAAGHLIGAVGPIRRLAMREGLALSSRSSLKGYRLNRRATP